MNIILPELGEGIDNVEVTDVLVKKGEQVKSEDVLLVVESDKASMEIPSEKSGTILNVLINKGDSIKPGDLIFELENKEISDISSTENKAVGSEDLNEDASDKEKDCVEDIQEEVTPDIQKEMRITPPPLTSSNASNNIIATPSVRKLARELGCDLSKIRGSEKNNRIIKEDVLNHIKSSFQEPSSERAEKKSERKCYEK